MTADDALRAWLDWLTHARRLSPRTLESYAHAGRLWLAFLARHRGGPQSLSDLAGVQAAELRAHLAERRAGDQPGDDPVERRRHDERHPTGGVPPDEFLQGRRHSFAGLLDEFAFGGGDRPRVVLPLAMKPRLLPPDVFDQHPLPQTLIEISQPCDALQRQPAGGRDDPSGLDRALARRGMDSVDAPAGQPRADPLGLGDSGRAERDVERAADAALHVVVGRGGSDQDQVLGHVGGAGSGGLNIQAAARAMPSRSAIARA